MEQHVTPKVSVIMSVHQEDDDFLEQSLASVLSQSLREWELIVVDDGMTESNIECLGRFTDPRVRTLSNATNQGLTRSLNTAARAATGEYLARLDSDDWSHRDRLAQQYAFLSQHPEYVLCGSRIQEDFDGTRRDPEVPFVSGDDRLKRTLSSFNPFAHSSLFFRRNTFNSIGGYAEKYRYAQDYDLVFRMSQNGLIENLPTILTYRRVRHGQISWRHNKVQVYNSLTTRLRAHKAYGGNPSAFAYLLKSLGVLVLPSGLTRKLRDLFS